MDIEMYNNFISMEEERPKKQAAFDDIFDSLRKIVKDHGRILIIVIIILLMFNGDDNLEIMITLGLWFLFCSKKLPF